jgi:hypothetical protein
MKLTGSLYAISSIRDTSGNVYWALRYIDHETGKVVEGQVGGNDSNIYGLLFHWNIPNDWDRSVIFNRIEMPKREFKRLVKKMKYAGCTSEDLAKYIRTELAAPNCPIVGQ